MLLKINDDRSLQTLLVFLWGGFLLYLNTFGNAWSFDDLTVVLYNPDIRSLPAFIEDRYPGRPLREISLLLDYQLFGQNPVGWHLQNVFWHALNAWLVFQVARRLTTDRRIVWLASLLFLVHPIQVEVVAQASHRKDSLALLFILIATLCYLQAVQGKHRRILWFGAALLCIVIGCQAKINAIVTPLLFVAYELTFLEKEERFLLKSRFLLGLLVLLAGIFLAGKLDVSSFHERAAFSLMRNSPFEEYSLTAYFLTTIKSWGFLLGRLIWPQDLAVNYMVSPPRSWLDAWVVGTLFSLVVALVVSWRMRRRAPLGCFALLWVLLFYLPTANLWPFSWFAADRYLYAPSAGFCLVAALLLVQLVPSDKVLVGTAVVLLGGMALLTLQQNRTWADAGTLWSRSLQVNPASARALGNVGLNLYRDNPAKNLQLHLEASRLNPYDGLTHFNVGKLYEQQGNDTLALQHYREFFRLFRPALESSYRIWAEQLQAHVREKYGVELSFN